MLFVVGSRPSTGVSLILKLKLGRIVQPMCSTMEFSYLPWILLELALSETAMQTIQSLSCMINFLSIFVFQTRHPWSCANEARKAGQENRVQSSRSRGTFNLLKSIIGVVETTSVGCMRPSFHFTSFFIFWQVFPWQVALFLKWRVSFWARGRDLPRKNFQANVPVCQRLCCSLQGNLV